MLTVQQSNAGLWLHYNGEQFPAYVAQLRPALACLDFENTGTPVYGCKQITLPIDFTLYPCGQYTITVYGLRNPGDEIDPELVILGATALVIQCPTCP